MNLRKFRMSRGIALLLAVLVLGVCKLYHDHARVHLRGGGGFPEFNYDGLGILLGGGTILLLIAVVLTIRDLLIYCRAFGGAETTVAAFAILPYWAASTFVWWLVFLYVVDTPGIVRWLES